MVIDSNQNLDNMLKMLKNDENENTKNTQGELDLPVVTDLGGKGAPKKDTATIKLNAGVTFLDSKGKKEEGPEVPVSPGRMTRSNYSQVANVRISSETNIGGLSSPRLESPRTRVVSPSSTTNNLPFSGMGMFTDRISSL